MEELVELLRSGWEMYGVAGVVVAGILLHHFIFRPVKHLLGWIIGSGLTILGLFYLLNHFGLIQMSIALI